MSRKKKVRIKRGIVKMAADMAKQTEGSMDTGEVFAEAYRFYCVAMSRCAAILGADGMGRSAEELLDALARSAAPVHIVDGNGMPLHPGPKLVQ